ncbi:PREDICTED: uncharacterized protein LOC108766986 [Trachymyrmex cornetzi]|uniref:uncharacterized protein LOC108766986 n=1 Tax=Trachymyrmex cornetzi TaxID=471704 RepID=UPI00084F3664|nr:PREDICTED: uncharacterized protein LOC108766986 [Trachymyrmex cornetzi]
MARGGPGQPPDSQESAQRAKTAGPTNSLQDRGARRLGGPRGDPPAEVCGRCPGRILWRSQGGVVIPGAANLFREVARRQVFHEWRDSLRNSPPTKGTRTTETILPCLDEWAGRGWGGLSFHLTQVLTGHECFGEYLCRIGKELMTQCHHCDEPRHTAQHTLEVCPAWAEERGALRRVIGEDFSLPAVVKVMVGREKAWMAVSSF